MNKKHPFNEMECPLCSEYLVLHKEGTMTNKNTGDFIYIFGCEECNQSFALDDDEKMKLIPYDFDMKLIENKCKVCEKIENYNEKGIFLLNVDTAYYEFHCFDCVTPILQKWINENAKEKIKLNKKNIQQISELYDFHKNNEMLQELKKNPNKYKDTMDKFERELNKKSEEKK